jgi:hypothetical protein
MRDVVRRMIEVARGIEAFDIGDALRAESRGIRLFAYVYLYTRPEAQFLSQVVESVTAKEDTTFGQYWGIQAVGRVMSSTTDVPQAVKTKLHAFEAKLPAGSDRAYEIRKLLRQQGSE